MVYYFKSTLVDPPAFVYVGKDKEENEDLIKFGWEEDVCDNKRCSSTEMEADFEQFHVDNLSSAHVYLRLKTGESWTSISKGLLEDCAQLTKANSIEGEPKEISLQILIGANYVVMGNKKDNITVIYTPWSNLRKDASMATGQVSFHDPKMVKKVHVTVRQNAIVNRLNKTREEKFPDFREEKEADQREKRKVERIDREQQKAKDRDEKQRREQLRWQKDHAYDDMMREDEMVSNQDRDADFYDDDFM